MWYVIIGLAALFIVLGLVHSHNVKVSPPTNDNNDDEYSYRIHSHGRGKE